MDRSTQPSNPQELLRANPRVDERQLRDAVEAIRALRACGCKRAEYNLVPPFTRPPPRTPPSTR